MATQQVVVPEDPRHLKQREGTLAQLRLVEHLIDLVVVGADRIAANGDVANKIGTYAVAVLAKDHEIPFYVAAPLSTIDRSIATGADIPIEIRDRDEVARIGDRVVLPQGVEVEQPAFDVTPAKYVTGIITEKGVLRPPYRTAIDAAFAR